MHCPLGLLAALSLFAPLPQDGAGRGPIAAAAPSFLVVIASGLGSEDLGCCGGAVATPRIDALAASGVRLTDCYAAASRSTLAWAGLLTARVPERWSDGAVTRLPGREITLASLLSRAGYATSLVGAWQLGGDDGGPPALPGEHGFLHWFVASCELDPAADVDAFVRGGETIRVPHADRAEVFADEAIRWLREEASRDRPFLLVVRLGPPSDPREPDASSMRLDGQVGRVVGALDELGLGERTFVLFTSDSVAPARASQRLRGGAGTLWEGGIRVPAIVRWQAHHPPGMLFTRPVGALDVLPSLCGIAHVEVPSDRAIDGTDLSPIFDGVSAPRETPLFWLDARATAGPGAVLRESQFVLTAHWTRAPTDDERGELGEFSLWDLYQDLGQQRDLASRDRERFAVLSRSLRSLSNGVFAERRRQHEAAGAAARDR